MEATIGKKIKKAVKKVTKSVSKAWKAVSKLVKNVASVIVSALKKVWDKVIMPMLDFVADILGLKDKDLIQVAANTQPLFEEDLAWIFKDNIVMRSLLQDTDIVEEMRQTILHGMHNTARGYIRYGEDNYSRGLPQITLSAGKTTNSDTATLGMWRYHCNIHGYTNPFTKVDDLPIRDGRFDIVGASPRDATEAVLKESYAYNTQDEVVTIGGFRYAVDWGTFNYELEYMGKDPNFTEDRPYTPEELALRTDKSTMHWQVTTIQQQQYLIPKDLTLSGRILDAPRISLGVYLLEGQEPVGNSYRGFWVNLDEIDAARFPMVFTYSAPVQHNEVTSWTVLRDVEVSYPDPPIVEPPVVLEPVEPSYLSWRIDGPEDLVIEHGTETLESNTEYQYVYDEEVEPVIITVTGTKTGPTYLVSDHPNVTITDTSTEDVYTFTVVFEDPNLFDETLYTLTLLVHEAIEDVSYELVRGPLETNPNNMPTVRQLSGSIQDALSRYFEFTFYVNSGAYTPYPDNLGHQFKYMVPQDRVTEADFTGAGATDSIFTNYSDEFMLALPVVVLKEEGVWIDSNKASANYVTSNRLLKKVGLEVQPLVDSIRGSDGAADNDLQTAAFRLGVDILSLNQGCLAYVFEFFNFIHATTVSSEDDFNNSNRNTTKNMIQGVKNNNIMLEEGSFVTSYHYAYSTRAVVSGLATKKKGFIERSATDTQYTITRHNGNGTGVRLIFRDLVGAYVVRPEGAPKAKMAAMTLATSDDPDFFHSYVIPIMVGPYKKVSPLLREELFARCKYLTVTSGTYTKIRWYKTPKFLKIIGVVITIVTAVITLGSGTGFGAALGAAIAAGGTALVSLATSFAIQSIMAYARTRLIALAFEKVLTALGGGEWAAVVALIAAAMTSSALGGADYSRIALELVDVSTKYYGSELNKEFKSLQTEVGATYEAYQEAFAEHDAAMKSMEVNVLGLSHIHTYKAETPELFFSRAELDTTEFLSSFDALLGLDIDLDLEYMTL